MSGGRFVAHGLQKTQAGHFKLQGQPVDCALVDPEYPRGGRPPECSSSSGQNWSFRLPFKFVPRAIVRIPRDLWIMISPYD